MTRQRHTSSKRSGVILLVVITLLTLFAVVGVTFVIFAQSEASAARVWRDGETLQRPDMDSEMLLAYFLNQLIYDTDNPHSALRGHSLARSVYGKAGGTVPFNGTGRIHTNNDPTLDDFYQIDYTNYAGGAPRDPDQYGSPNVPYTYPDYNNLYLAAVRGNDGAVLIPSFARTNPQVGQPWITLRPNPAYHTAFPAMEAGGDVKNLADSPGTLVDPVANTFGNNDSVWMDLGFPVMKGPDGRKFKPLFAPLVTDLDNRINVNIHGNKFGTWNVQAGGPIGDRGRFWSASEHGWGPWEVNPYKVLRGMDGANEWDGEWRKLLLGNGTTPGRLHSNDWFYATRGPFLPSQDHYIKGKFYSMTDCNCHIPYIVTLAVPGVPAMPVGNGWRNSPGTPATAAFPNDDRGNSRDNYTGGDDSPYPCMYNYFDPAGWNIHVAGARDRRFGASHLEALLRYNDRGSPALSSDLFLLCPKSFGDPGIGAKARRLVTTHSFDLDRPGVAPCIWDPSAQPYRLNAGQLKPSGDPVPFPAVPLGAVPSNSEFTADFKALSAALGRIDLNRKMVDYPGVDGTTQQIPAGSMQQFQDAQADRQQMARDIFNVLRKVTGAADPATATKDTPDYDALRWLAQLAANIVDYVDGDDYMTPFNWTGTEWVFGTELPRLLVNEAYAEISNDSADPLTGQKATMPYKVKFWVELHNPFRNDSFGNLADGGAARLALPDGTGIYQVVVATQPNADIRKASNVLGDPTAGNIQTAVSKWEPEPAPATQPTLAANEYVLVRPSNTNTSGADGSNQGYYLVGPKDNFPGTGPTPTLRIKDQQVNGKRSSMVYEVPTSTDLTAPLKHTILLRRLACPALPAQTDPAQANYNPYVTIDYVEDVATNDAVAYDANAQRMMPATVTDVTKRKSTGRNQPYAADKTQWNDQSDPGNQLAGQPQHTFFKINYKVVSPFDWLATLDRKVFNGMELLHVPGFKPHELTQQFMTGGVDINNKPVNKHQHRAPWYDQSARIFRFLEYPEGGHRIQGVTVGGRTVGRLNINTMWDVETFRAMVDVRWSDYYVESDVDNAFSAMLQSRTPGTVPGTSDRPFRGLAAPITAAGDLQYPNGVGIEDTLLRSDPNAPNRRLFEVTTLPNYANKHPFLQEQMFVRMGYHVTTRSNVFAVYLTVGFFEVLDDSDPTKPPKLGQEIGKAENRHIRHRMFSIVDRSNLTFDPANPTQAGPRPFFFDTLSAINTPGAGAQTLTLPAVSGNYEELRFTIQQNDKLVIDVGSRQEQITVSSANVATNQITAVFTQKHQNVGVPITNVGGSTQMGNPGPQRNFDPRNPTYSGLVRYFSIVE